MFGQSEEEKKKKELAKAMEEQKKLEEGKVKETAPGAGKKPEEKESGLAGLKKFGSGAGETEKTVTPAKKEEVKEEPAEEIEKPEEKPPVEEKPAPPEEPAEKPAPKKKGSDADMDKLKKQLEMQKDSIKDAEKEKEDAMKKSEELAGLVEDLTSEIKETKVAPQAAAPAAQPPPPSIEPKLNALEEKTAAQIKGLKETIEAATVKKEEEKKDGAEVAETMKKMFDKRLKELTEKLEESKKAPSPKEAPAAPGEVSGGLMAMGGGVEMQKEMDKVKRSLKDLATLMDAFKEEAENRFLAIDRELENVERVPDLEDKMKQFERKLGEENVQKLRTLISSADDLREEVIPTIVKRIVDERIDPYSKKVKGVDDAIEKAIANMQTINSDLLGQAKDIKALSKFDDRILKLEEEMGGVKKLISELRVLVRDLDKEQKKSADDKMKEILPKMIETEASKIKQEFAGRLAFIDDKLQSVENMVAESHKEISELATLDGKADGLGDEMQKANEDLERIRDRIDVLKSRDMDLEDKIQSLQTPKEIITELDNKTKDIVDIREFFARRADGLEQRINHLDERAVPPKKLHAKVDALANEIKALRETQKGLEKKVESEKKEFQALIKHHAEEKRKLEEKIKEQRTRVSMLLHELK
jgi:chromosome segregation ATPase